MSGMFGGAFRGTMAAASKASRAPLNSKQANKNFYKGTGSMPGLGRKATGRFPRRGGSKAPYIMMPERMRHFVVPENLDTSPMKPYVSSKVKVTLERRSATGLDIADAKPRDDVMFSKRGGLFSPAGFDAAYYLQLARKAGLRNHSKRG